MIVPDSIEIKESNGKGLFAKRLFKKESIVFHFDGKIGADAHTNPESFQIDEDKFLESTAGFDNFFP